MARVTLIRHALSAWNVEGRWQGQADPPLSPEGRAQASWAASMMGPVDLVITSDLARARQTGELLAPGTTHRIEPLLREFDVGHWSGRTRAEIMQEWPDELAAFDAGQLSRPPGGESRADFDARVLAAASRVATICASEGRPQHPSRPSFDGDPVRAVVVSHGGVVRALARLLGRADHHVEHLCGYRARAQDDTLALKEAVDLLDGAPEPGGGGDRGRSPGRDGDPDPNRL